MDDLQKDIIAAPDSPSPESDALLRQAVEIWIDPEIQRRIQEGRLPPEGFVIAKAQVIFREAQAPEVRLNDEVNAVARLKVKSPIEAGQTVFFSDIDDVEDIHLTDADPDAGHITLLATANGVVIAFDLRQNATKAMQRLDLAAQFRASAATALSEGHPNVAADNLFSAVELIARAELMLLPIEGHESNARVDHKRVYRTYRRRIAIGWTSADGASLLQRLTQLRGRARYGSKRLDEPELPALLEQAEAMEMQVRAKVPPRVAVDPVLRNRS